MKPLQIGELQAKIPVIQGGMGVGISLSKLAGNVALCGGIGVISSAQIGFQAPDFADHPIETNLRVLKEEIKKAKEIAKGGIIGVNIMVVTQRYKEYVKAAVNAGADLIISGAGLPTTLPELVEGTKTKIAPIVSTIKAASVICKMWDRKYKKIPDLVVVEGPKAGGHLGFHEDEIKQYTRDKYEEEIKGIFEIIKEYGQKYSKKIPVVVAGGIFDRKDVQHVLDLGADGVQMGTRFVTTYECDAAPEYKEAYLKARKEDIQIIKSPVGMPGRAIRNTFICNVKEKKEKIDHCFQCITTCKPKEIPYCITKALVRAAKGDVANGLLFCGENAYRCQKIEHVSDIMEEIAGKQ